MADETDETDVSNASNAMPMQVTVKLFGPQAKLVGREAVTLTLDGVEPTCLALREALAEAEPTLAASLPSSRFAVNHEYVAEGHRIRRDDELALIGMISGG
ncbi:MoaD/ThiS family protein [Phycisphaerales bacterium AB-hyl4]|uniref:Molybdopterin synthase sulfur carrier subunit n=1 Tax=Natronomicrosphaera hydrolytica TaxID=3242702 RepID=A0ABV4U583_9BACT